MRRRARVRELMARENVPSLFQLAARLGVHYTTLSLWDRGKVSPSEELRERVYLALGGRYPEAWLFPYEMPQAPVEATG